MQNIGFGILSMCGKQNFEIVFGFKCHSSLNLLFFGFLSFPLLLLLSHRWGTTHTDIEDDFAQVIKSLSLSATTNSPDQNYIHRNDQLPSNNDMTPGLASTVFSKRWFFLYFCIDN